MPPYLLQQHGEIGNESENTSIPDGAFDIEVTLNTYTHLSLDDAKEELERINRLA